MRRPYQAKINKSVLNKQNSWDVYRDLGLPFGIPGMSDDTRMLARSTPDLME